MVIARAHPGGTDAYGGHYDYENREYHYHHGYGAHQHYDVDGDGYADCPYDFRDATESRSGTSVGTGGTHTPYPSVSPPPRLPTATPSQIANIEQDEEGKTVPGWIDLAMGVLILWVVYLLYSTHRKSSEIRGMSFRHRQETDAVRKEASEKVKMIQQELADYRAEYIAETERHKDEIEKMRAEYVLLRQKHQLLLNQQGDALISDKMDALTIPPGVYFINDGIPVKGKINDRRPFGDYTVYCASNGKRYHSDCYCGSGYSLRAVHLYDVAGKKQPCKNCVWRPVAEVPEWYVQVKELRKIVKGDNRNDRI